MKTPRAELTARVVDWQTTPVGRVLDAPYGDQLEPTPSGSDDRCPPSTPGQEKRR